MTWLDSWDGCLGVGVEEEEEERMEGLIAGAASWWYLGMGDLMDG